MSDDNTIELNRRRVLGGVVTIGAAAAAAGAGTFAAFSDTEGSTGNSVSAGTLDLTTNGDDVSQNVIDITNAVPGDSDSGTITLANAGSADGTIAVELGAVSDTEGTTNDAEKDVEGSSPGSDGGELAENVVVDLELDGATESGTVNNLPNTLFSGISLNNGSTKDLSVTFTVDSNAGDEIQGDDLTVDFTFTLTQA